MRKMIYCPHCGEEVDASLKKCKHCHKLIYIKDHPWRDYFCEKWKDEITDNLFETVVNLIKKHCYGILVSLTIVFTTVTLITQPHINHVEEPPTFEKMSTMDFLVGCWRAKNDETDTTNYKYIELRKYRDDIGDALQAIFDLEEGSMGADVPTLDNKTRDWWEYDDFEIYPDHTFYGFEGHVYERTSCSIDEYRAIYYIQEERIGLKS